MTPAESYDQLIDDFGRQLDRAAARRPVKRPARRATIGIVVLACLAAPVLLATGTRGGVHLDVVAQAEAALGPPQELIHLVTTARIETIGAPGLTEPRPSTTEQWSTGSPERWRIATSTGPAVLTGPHGPLAGPEQFSYADGTAEYYAERRNLLEVTTGIRNADPAAPLTADLGSDPLVRLRSMLAAGRLHDAGTRVVDGRTVRRLVGDEPRGTGPSWPIEYDVDPRSFAPVEVTIQMPFDSPPSPQVGTPVVVITVDSYDRLPLNAATADLLTIRPTGIPTVYRKRGVARSPSTSARSAERAHEETLPHTLKPFADAS